MPGDHHRMVRNLRALVAGGLVLAEACVSATAANDYPTEARVDYVIGCMASNGQTQEAMRKCSCSIDKIAVTIPYSDYVEYETVTRMQNIPGERTASIRGVGWIKDLQDKFRLAQVQADLECFH